MDRWRTGELKLSGDLVARILTRWQNEVPRLPATVRIRRGKLAQTLVRMHETGAARVLDRQVRADFKQRFGKDLRDPEELYAAPDMPQDILDYVDGGPPLTDARLAEVLSEWRSGEQRLSGDVVAQTLMRWQAEVPTLTDEHQPQPRRAARDPGRAAQGRRVAGRVQGAARGVQRGVRAVAGRLAPSGTSTWRCRST